MSTVGIFLFSLIVHLTILSCYVGIAFASPCSRVPQGTGAGKSVPSGNFGIQISSGSGYYQPGRQYTSKKSVETIFKFNFKSLFVYRKISVYYLNFWFFKFRNQVSLERKNTMRNREGGKPKFIGFFLVVEQKSTTASDYAEVADIDLLVWLVVCLFAFCNDLLLVWIYVRNFHQPYMANFQLTKVISQLCD